MTAQQQNEAIGSPALEREDEAKRHVLTTDATLRAAEYRREQTSLGLCPEVTVLKSSEGLGWTALYAALTDERPHEAFHRAISDVWFATTSNGLALSRAAGDRQDQAQVPPNMVSISAPGESQRDVIATPVSALHVYLKAEILAEVEMDLFSRHRSTRAIIPVFATEDRTLVQILRTVGAALDEPARGHALKMDHLSRALAVHILQYHSTDRAIVSQPKRPPSLNSKQGGLVLGYIDENLENDIRIADLAALVGLSPVQFMRRFKATIGMSAYQYVMRARVQRAKTLLSNTRFALAEVALICGFTNQSHLTAVFKHFTNVSPGAYRRAIL